MNGIGWENVIEKNYRTNCIRIAHRFRLAERFKQRHKRESRKPVHSFVSSRKFANFTPIV